MHSSEAVKIFYYHVVVSDKCTGEEGKKVGVTSCSKEVATRRVHAKSSGCPHIMQVLNKTLPCGHHRRVRSNSNVLTTT